MYLTGHRFNLLGRVMATLAEPHDELAIRTRVGELMLDLLGAQHYASFVWNAAAQSFGAAVRINMGEDNIGRYERYFQFHDPITPQLQQHRRAVSVTQVMPQNELKRTEFFNDFLARDGLYWGVNLYAWTSQGNIGDMRIWRDKRRENFSRDDLDLLNFIQPALTAALHRCSHAQSAAAAPDARDARDPRVAPGVDASSPFALLSAREQDVARLLAAGLADKEIAQRLSISITTVRTHIDHAFRKFNVNKRVALIRALES
jgi:DNA-binding CsgD family transcriptional regulator